MFGLSQSLRLFITTSLRLVSVSSPSSFYRMRRLLHKWFRRIHSTYQSPRSRLQVQQMTHCTDLRGRRTGPVLTVDAGVICGGSTPDK
ncbi:hypothetical protein FA95DRAFT_755294 [Auriscalpium vulgare]|uniref:Uncharacterized protein n=1 Tax=Auriscalpium vulgare TaxID=40419 RepID=A0ACB8SBI8_9AGAM|nr:hypothetical protein FA95DRAFT_755294 [Auriscalpium vulgare]